MPKVQRKLIKIYDSPIVLISSILLGGLVGHLFGQDVQCLKPLGDIFLNLIFTAIVPLIFFSVSSAISRTGSFEKLGKIAFSMAVIFVFTGVVAAIYAIFVVKLFPPALRWARKEIHMVSEKRYLLPMLDAACLKYTLHEHLN